MPDPSRLGAFLEELKRRRVIRVAIVYAVVGFGVMQVAGEFFPALQLPPWTVTFTAILILLGFPLALGLAWAFQVSPDRGARTEGSGAPIPHPAWFGGRATGYVGLGILLGLVAFGLVYNPARNASDGAAIRSIAVLPFANLSTDGENEAFSDGLTEELLNALARIDRLRVTARTSSFAFKNVNHDIVEIGRRLNVDVLLEGSVRKAADRLRITVKLISVQDGSQLWSETYDRTLADVFAIQEEIARSIVAQLLPRFAGSGQDRLVDATTRSVSAYEAYLQGRHQFWQQGGEEGLRRAAAFFEAAVEQDPDYALAWAALADAYMLLGGSGFARPHDIFPEATAAAQKALALDARLAEGYVALASINWQYDWDWTAAAMNYRRSFSVNPLLHTRCVCYAWYLAVTGDPDAAVLEAERARTMDPLARLPRIISGWMYLLAGRYDDAQAQVDEIFAANPKDGSARRIAAWIHWAQGRRDDAVAELGRTREEQDARGGFAETGSPLTVAELATMYARTGREADARVFASVLTRRAQRQYIPPEYIAAIHGALGEYDAAFRYLDEAFDNRSNLPQFNALPFSEPLRDQPRYHSLMDRAGLSRSPTHP